MNFIAFSKIYNWFWLEFCLCIVYFAVKLMLFIKDKAHFRAFVKALEEWYNHWPKGYIEKWMNTAKVVVLNPDEANRLQSRRKKL